VAFFISGIYDIAVMIAAKHVIVARNAIMLFTAILDDVV
jgi:hypothetical protein